MQMIVDTAATDAQAAALARIMSGEDTGEMKTMWVVYARMSPTKYPTLRKPIDLTLDIEARTGRVRIDGIAGIDVKPVPNIALMAPLFVGGVMNLYWIAGLAILVAVPRKAAALKPVRLPSPSLRSPRPPAQSVRAATRLPGLPRRTRRPVG